MSIKRWDVTCDGYGPDTHEADDGPFVAYDDHVAEVERLTRELERTKETLRYDDLTAAYLAGFRKRDAEVERLTADLDYYRNTAEARIGAVTRAHKREDKKQATIDRLTADLAAARADFFAVADRLGTMYEPDMGPRYPGTLADVMRAIDAVEGERDQARAQRDGLAKALRGVSKSIEAHMYLNDPPADENMDEYDYMMKPLWEAARAALAALPTKEDDRG